MAHSQWQFPWYQRRYPNLNRKLHKESVSYSVGPLEYMCILLSKAFSVNKVSQYDSVVCTHVLLG